MLREPLIKSNSYSSANSNSNANANANASEVSHEYSMAEVSESDQYARDRVGRWMGVAAMIITSVYTIVLEANTKHPGYFARGSVWSVFSQLLLFAWCYGFNLKVWEIFDIDSPKLLNLRAPVLNSESMRNLASAFSTFLAGIILLHKILTGDNQGSPYPFVFDFIVWIAIFITVMEARIRWSTKTPEGSVTDRGALGFPYRSARWKWFTMFFSSKGVIGAALGLTPVSFFHTYVTDGMTSACLLLWNIEFSWCCFGLGFHESVGLECKQQCAGTSTNQTFMKPIMYSIPFWLRLFQEIRVRNWPNAIKYVTCLMLVASGGLHAQASFLPTFSTNLVFIMSRIELFRELFFLAKQSFLPIF
jgi:hypothetical protein